MARLVGQTRRSGASWLLLALALLVAFALVYLLAFGHVFSQALGKL